jgi:adenylate cyclase
MAAMESVCTELKRLYPDEAGSQIAAAYLDVYAGRREGAMDRLCRAIELDPNMASAYGLYGQTLAMAKEPDRSLEQFETALSLSPRDTERWSIYIGMALAHFAAARYERAIEAAQIAMRLRPTLPFTHGVIASARAHLGDLEQARAAVLSMLDSQPSTQLSAVEFLMASVDAEIAARYLAGLERAGLESARLHRSKISS